MIDKPGLFGRLMAFAGGEVSADTLEAYRRAGSMVYALIQDAESQRLHLKIQGLTPWTASVGTQTYFLCVWNAFALQTLGDQLLAADYESNPATIGYVPSKIAAQILAFYEQVESWLSCAHQARGNNAYALEVAVPAALPPWSEIEPCPRSYVESMRVAARSLRIHAELAMGGFEPENVSPEQRPLWDQLRQLLAKANGKMDYAEQLSGVQVSEALHERIEGYVKEAIESYYHLGQCLAMPQILERKVRPKPSTKTRSLPPEALALPGQAQSSNPSLLPPEALALPGQPGFNPWCITDPVTRPQWKRDPEACESIREMWQHDPDPQSTLAIQDEINKALFRGIIAYATNNAGESLGFYYDCPWAPVYLALQGTTIGGRRLRVLQKFTYVVDANRVLDGGKFQRKIFVGSFHSTERIDFCNPHEGPHHTDWLL
jgi:hypothetical protein